MRAPATGISHYLDRTLQPHYNRLARSSTFVNDIDFVRQLEQYRDRGLLLPTTQFLTADVQNLYTMIPIDGALAALGYFLSQHAHRNQIHGMTIDTIMKMARIVLNTNCFFFENKYYQQIRGGAMGSPFTMTLANIYMLEWEQILIEYQQSHRELYGRSV